MVQKSRGLSFSVKVVCRFIRCVLIELSQHPERPCHDADRIAAEQLATVRRKIDRLRKLEAELERITSHCHSDQISDCYVIRALANHDLCADEHD